MSAQWVPPRRATFGWRNRIRSATLTGTGWNDLEALKTVELEHSAASAGLALSDLVLTASWSTPQWGRAVSVINHNGSELAKGKLRVWSGDRLLWDTAAAPPDDAGDGWSWLWPSLPEEVVPYGDPRWWMLRPDPEDIAGYTPAWSILLPELEPWDRIELRFDDPSNPQHRLYIGHVYAGPMFQAARQHDKGATVGWVDAGTVPGADQGVPIGDGVLPPRSMRLNFSRLTHAEAWSGIFSMLKEAGRNSPILTIMDPGAGQYMPHQSGLFFLRGRGGVTINNLRASAALDLIEWRM